MWKRFLRRPRELWLRRALFQVHLWVGVVLAAYVAAVGLTGSVLVFKGEIVDAMVGRAAAGWRPAPGDAGLDAVAANLRARYARARVAVIGLPNHKAGEYRAIVITGPGDSAHKLIATADGRSGRLTGEVDLTTSWLGICHHLHILLLMGRPGLKLNGVGAALVLGLLASGLFLWWPGVKRWREALRIHGRAGWKRINWDTHNTAGLYLAPMLFLWALTTIYFVWPEPSKSVLGLVSPVTPAQQPPRAAPVQPAAQRAGLQAAVDDAAARMPEAHVMAVALPARPGAPLTVFLSTDPEPPPSDEMPRDMHRAFYHPVTGERLGALAPAEPRTLADRILALAEPLHFGTEWGLAVKILWALAGLSLPVLGITGGLMYWNRYLGKRWRALGRPARA
jgi:uncharacterized iron-regulated membrane protein